MSVAFKIILFPMCGRRAHYSLLRGTETDFSPGGILQTLTSQLRVGLCPLFYRLSGLLHVAYVNLFWSRSLQHREI